MQGPSQQIDKRRFASMGEVEICYISTSRGRPCLECQTHPEVAEGDSPDSSEENEEPDHFSTCSTNLVQYTALLPANQH
ncbi:hypothetical protein UPYG_G00014560 [Umbra pygmaea]|uniref:Uncharacterized protein n=1 Tax=Umbra pygmaea TaxID=75934 RepID=A0ABD0Y0C1_UMBPY